VKYVGGRSYLAIPGPTVVPERVLNAMHRAAPNIYEGDFIEMAEALAPDLRRLACSSAHVAIYTANGHGAWEAANANMFSRGDRALVAATGLFGLGWASSAERMGVAIEVIDFGRHAPADPNRIAEVLSADKNHEIRAVLLSHLDTATSVRNDIVAIRSAMDDIGHPALLAIDAIASLGCEEFRFDDWGVDVMVSASQKGLMVPPGLGFVWCSDKAIEASRQADLVTPYWDWRPRIFPQSFRDYHCGTAPTHHLFGLREALTMLLDDEGLERAWARHQIVARAVWAAFEAWGKEGDIALNIKDPNYRGHSVSAARIGSSGAGRLRRWMETEAGVTLGVGLGMAASTEPAYQDYLRLGHMGHVNSHMTLGVLAAMEAGMQALQIPRGTGALEAAARAVAGGMGEQDPTAN